MYFETDLFEWIRLKQIANLCHVVGVNDSNFSTSGEMDSEKRTGAVGLSPERPPAVVKVKNSSLFLRKDKNL